MATSRARKKKTENPASALVAALQFVQLAQPKDFGLPYQTHAVLHDGTAYATDGVLTAGHPINETHINAFPHTKTMLAALKRCGETLAVTQLDDKSISVTSGKFRATVPCLPEGMPAMWADPPIAPASDALRDAIAAVEHLAIESSPRVALASILLVPGSAIATNGHAILEAWHGVDLPPVGIILPKISAGVLSKISKPITNIGYSGKSVTFWFEDKSWLKSQLYEDKWPDHHRILDVKDPVPTPQPAPEGFFEAVKTLADFGEEVHFLPKMIATSTQPAEGAHIENEAIMNGPSFASKALLQMEGAGASIDFYSHKDRAFFFGENIRGCLMQVKRQN